MKIAIASDHQGYKLKNKLLKYLNSKNYEIVDYGTYNDIIKVDYPKFAFLVGKAVVNKECDYGLVICGTGIGISIACNKVKGVRCSKVDNVDEAKLTRKDNNSNVLALNGKMPLYKAKDIVDIYFNTSYSNIDRHNDRIKMISDYEDGIINER